MKKEIEKLNRCEVSTEWGMDDMLIVDKINEIVDILNSQLFEAKLIMSGIGESETKKEKKIKDVHWVCKDCGLKYGNHDIRGVATWHTGTCEICKRSKSVTEIRDFGYLKEDATKEDDNYDWYKPEIRELIRENLTKIHIRMGNSYGIDVSHLHKMISEYAEEQRNEAREIAVRMVLAGLIIRCEIEKKDMVSLEFLKTVDPEKLLKTDRD